MLKNIINKVFKNVSGKKICVIGDLMLDLYFIGDVKRISPEAPVQVFEKKNTEPKLGGAANVGLNIASLGVTPYMMGVIGNDEEGKILLKEFKKNGIDSSGIIVTNDRPTTNKTRIIAASHHLLRIDSESKKDISAKTEEKFINNFKKNIKKFNVVILQDYNKGVLTKRMIESVISISGKNKIKVLVDPKFDNFFEFKNVFAFKPNRKELEDALAKKAKSSEELDSFCFELIEKINCENLVLTLGENGIKIFEKEKNKINISSINTHARKVSDVSGAGDTVISTMAVCLAGGACLKDAVKIANIAAGIVVEEVGIVPIYKDLLVKNIQN